MPNLWRGSVRNPNSLRAGRLVSRLWELAHRDPTINVEHWTAKEKKVFDRCFKRYGKDFTHDLVRQARMEGWERNQSSEPVAGQIKVIIDELAESVWVQITSGDERHGFGFLHGTPRSTASALRWGDEIEFGGGTMIRSPRFIVATGRRMDHCDCQFCQPGWN